ncbi:chaperone modulator CbpM [Cognataquiflexum rubidum]|uniref:chaperone modulator CbpM n=1 Tax=Cognataquiflexum rubidum TaxID=2922273 RepID=UPI001F135347|nr:chaperone modulator CbpM [Cognataquiflexum rubidum]MCH6233221.1 chaperone modulator CbpM [Cognataquiflexum rubidum]
MARSNHISIHTFCQYHGIESRLIFTFQELGLVEIVEEEAGFFLEEEALSRMEQIVRLYKDLDLSPEGVEVVMGLLGKIEQLQEENLFLIRKLRKWEK